MAQRDAQALDPDEPGRLQLVERVRIGACLDRRQRDRRTVLRVVGGDEERERLRVHPEAADGGQEHALDLLADRERVGQRLAARELLGGQDARQLEERERVAAGRRHEPVADRGRDRLAQELGGGTGVEAAHEELRQPTRHHPLARREHERDAAGLQAPPGEDDRVGRRAIEPLGVVDDAEHAAVLRREAEQPVGRERDQEAILHAPGSQAERTRERVRVRLGQPVEQAEHRMQQRVQPGVRQLALGLDAGRAQHPALAGVRDRLLEQRGLADARLAAHDDRAAVRQQRPEPRTLDLSPEEHVRCLMRRAPRARRAPSFSLRRRARARRRPRRPAPGPERATPR